MHGDHHHRLEADRRALLGALAIVVAVMAAEISAGILAGSLALLADAGHMVTDAAALSLRLELPLSQRFGLAHSTLQVEHAPPGVLQHGELPVARR